MSILASHPAPVFTQPKSSRYRLQRSCRPDFWIIVDSKNGNHAIGPWLIDAAEDYFNKLVAQEAREQAKTVVEKCWSCGRADVITDGNIQPVHCPACTTMLQDQSLGDLRGLAKSLIAGEHPFDQLDTASRLEQLVSLVGFDYTLLPVDLLVDVAGRCAEEIARRLGSIEPTVRRVSVFDGATTKPVTCPEGVWVGGPAPDERTRFELEGRIEIDPSEAHEPHADDVPTYRIPIVAGEPDWRPAA